MLESVLKKLTESVDALTAAVLTNGAAPSATAAETPSPTPAPTAAAAAPPAPTPAPVPAPEPTPTPSVPAPDAGVEVTKKLLAETTVAVAQAKGREAAMGILSKYGATKVPELTDPSVWPQVYAELAAALAS